MEWINVKDRFPKWEDGIKCKRFLVISINGEEPVIMYYFYSDQQWSLGWGDTQKITHWMPLPKLPKDGE